MEAIHFDVKSHTCTSCNEIFDQYSELRHHIMNTHNLLGGGALPPNQITTYECDFCDVKTFLRLESLNYHIEKAHLGYKCYICDRELHSPTSLIRHINIVHSDVTSHRCNIATKNLTRHITI